MELKIFINAENEGFQEKGSMKFPIQIKIMK